jgi:release factor glutamine methyltransferase
LAKHVELHAVSDSARFDTELLLCQVLGKSGSYLRAWPEVELSADQTVHFEQLLERRLAGEPIAYIIGQQGFWTLDLAVSPATLIPRPETELLVEYLLEQHPSQRALAVLDLGTGTGAIALALASERPQWQLLGVDVEAAAVALARHNQQRCLPEARNIRFLQSDWFAALASGVFDIIVSNPPYIDGKDPHLDQGDVRFEPRSALVAASDGLAAFETIIAQAPAFLSDGGTLLFEHGCEQGPALRGLLQRGGFVNVFTEQDLAGLDRISGGERMQGDRTGQR